MATKTKIPLPAEASQEQSDRWDKIPLDRQKMAIEMLSAEWKQKLAKESAPQPQPAPSENKICGMFRKCIFPEGEKWLVELFHAHKPGDKVWIHSRGGRTKILLGESIPVTQGNKQMGNFYRIERDGVRFRPQPAPQPLRALPTNAKPSAIPSEWN